MTKIEGSMPFLDALFTSTSGACVTGLIVADTATYFTAKGQLVILALMQAGGVGSITFRLFFTLILRTGFGLNNQKAAQEFMDTDNLQTAQNLLRQVIGGTLTIELVETVLMFGLWLLQVDFESLGSKVFHSIFHGVLAFCQAGFSTFTNGLNNALNQESYYLLLVFAVMIFLGGLGFHVIKDLTSIGKLRDRMKYPWKKWEMGAIIVLFSSIALIIFMSVFSTIRGKREVKIGYHSISNEL